MNETPLYAQIKEKYESKGIDWIFNELLNWNTFSGPSRTLKVNDTNVSVSFTREAAGFKLVSVQSPERLARPQLQELDKRLSKTFPERLVYVESPHGVDWVWPRRLSSGSRTLEISHNPPGPLLTYLAQKLAGLKILDIEVRKGLTIAAVRNRVSGQFDSTKITANFYKEFSDQHSKLAEAIEGIEDYKLQGSYASTLLNRLMFIYFLQKKGFLNGDLNYLENCLSEVRKLNGKNNFYNFYKHLLTALFDSLGNKYTNNIDAEIKALLGIVPYVNGGIFQRQDLEQAHDIQIADEAFSEIFAFFNKYEWHLDTRATGKDNEINPEVMGYIFEQYINFESTGKKESGAYYTKHEVTSYMTEQTVIPRYLEKLLAITSVPLELLKQNPIRYIKPDNLQGFNFETGSWKPLPLDVEEFREIPDDWIALEKFPSQDELLLPDESWIQMFARRQRVDSLILKLGSGQAQTANDLVTYNLDQLTLIQDSHSMISKPDDLKQLWSQVSEITVLDPACGSGAFLFAALEHLEEIYDSLFEHLSLNHFEGQDLFGVRDTDGLNKKYLIRRHIALNNLFGTDIMPGAIETAKLRIFLALAACAESVQQLKPLPDLDFNLKCGNLHQGIYDREDAFRIAEDDISLGNLSEDVDKIIEIVSELYRDFIESTTQDSEDYPQKKLQLLHSLNSYRDEINRLFAKYKGADLSNLASWLDDRKPFHWFLEFPTLLARGGFEVIVANPPYIGLTRNTPFSPSQLDEMKNYDTFQCEDLYTICFERSLTLLAIEGRLAFITPLNLAALKTYEPMRTKILSGRYESWWSTYGIAPAKLFSAADIRNAIVIVSKGSDTWQTKHNLFTSSQLTYLFSTINYQHSDGIQNRRILRSGDLVPLASRIQANNAANKRNTGESSNSLWLRPTGRYWFPVLPGKPDEFTANFDSLNSVGDCKEIPLKDGEDPDVAFALLGSKIAYLWWSSTGNDMHTTPNTATELLHILQDLRTDAELLESAARVRAAALEAVFAYFQKGKNTVNIRWTSIRKVTDEFDKLVLERLALSHLWPDLQTWYDSVQHSQDSEKGEPIPFNKVQDLLGWG